MTIILVAALVFVLGLGMVVLFRSAISSDDALEREWADAVERRRARERGEGADRADGEVEDATGTEP